MLSVPTDYSFSPGRGKKHNVTTSLLITKLPEGNYNSFGLAVP